MSRNGKPHWTELLEPEPNSGCWLYAGYHVFTGYDYRPMYQRKLVARLMMSSPKGKQVNHTCHNSACVNPDHLYIGTQKDNMRDRKLRGWHKENFK